jgi:dsDNA-specific endonuclease/ATPase MutS2
MIFDFVLKRIRRALTFDRSKNPSVEDDDLENPLDTEPVVIEFRDVIDLHSIPPGQVRAVVEDYIDEAHRRGVRWVRIIHGKGIGVQREIVRSVLSQSESVVDYRDAPQEAGGWGATVVTLRNDCTPPPLLC